MINLKDVTLVSLDNCGDYISKNNIRIATISRIVPWITKHIEFGDFLFINPFNKNSHLINSELTGIDWYNDFVFKKIPYMIKTKYYLVIQYDGFPINFDKWTNDFLEYGYVGGGDTLQNGGFSLRNKEDMIRILNSNDKITVGNEDHYISHFLTNEPFQSSFKIKSADRYIANNFSYVSPITNFNESFGWHRSPEINEKNIYDVFQSIKLFDEDEIRLIKMYLLSKSVNTSLFNKNFMKFFNISYNDEFFNY